MKLFLYNCTQADAAIQRPKGSTFTLRGVLYQVTEEPHAAFARGQPPTGPWFVVVTPVAAPKTTEAS